MTAKKVTGVCPKCGRRCRLVTKGAIEGKLPKHRPLGAPKTAKSCPGSFCDPSTSRKETKKKDVVRKGTEMRTVPCRLSEDERRRYGEHVASLTRAIEESEDDLKQIAARVRAENKKRRAKRSDLSTRVETGVEPREIEVEIRNDFAAREQIVVRTDTGEIVDRRPIPPEDYQRTLPNTKTPKKKETEKAATAGAFADSAEKGAAKK